MPINVHTYLFTYCMLIHSNKYVRKNSFIHTCIHTDVPNYAYIHTYIVYIQYGIKIYIHVYIFIYIHSYLVYLLYFHTYTSR